MKKKLLKSLFLFLAKEALVMVGEKAIEKCFAEIKSSGNKEKAVPEIDGYKTPEEILPGMYVYFGGLIHPDIIPGHRIMGVVAYVEGETVHAVCLHERQIQWSSTHNFYAFTTKIEDGREAISEIWWEKEFQKNDASKLGMSKYICLDAIRWCNTYGENGVERTKAYLPTLSELRKVYPNLKAIKKSFQALGVKLFALSGIESCETNILTSTVGRFRLVRSVVMTDNKMKVKRIPMWRKGLAWPMLKIKNGELIY